MNNNKIKKQFNIVMNSNDLTSWSGDLAQAKYRVNPLTILKDTDYNKKYKVYFSIEHLQAPTADEIYGISLDISGNKIYHTRSYDGLTGVNIRPIHFIDTLEYQNFGTNKRGHVALDDQTPIIVQLTSLNYIVINYIITRTGTTLTAPSNYIACLRFEEL